jgi:peptidoglycan/LPS O-acetylase OafA/YrhL
MVATAVFLAARITDKPALRQKAFIAVAVTIALLSFTWTVAAAVETQAQIYFDLRARAWEFGLGALTSRLALLVCPRFLPASLFSLLGWAGIVHRFVIVLPHPPVASAGLGPRRRKRSNSLRIYEESEAS